VSDLDVPALRIRNLGKRYPSPEGGWVEVLALPRLDLARGETLGVVGESGSGKTTLLHVISGVVVADAGTVEILGERMTGRGEGARDRIRARRIGYVFQTFNLLPHLSALENVVLGMSFGAREGSGHGAAAREALARVGLAERLHYRPRQLSVGQQQRVAIARALAGRPSLVLADEPTANLDRRQADACLDLLLGFAEECSAAVLTVTHDTAALARFPRSLELGAPSLETST